MFAFANGGVEFSNVGVDPTLALCLALNLDCLLIEPRWFASLLLLLTSSQSNLQVKFS